MLWGAVAAICAAVSVLGYAVADAVTGEAQAVIDGFAAGALLVMLIDSMIPEARTAPAASPDSRRRSASPSPSRCRACRSRGSAAAAELLRRAVR